MITAAIHTSKGVMKVMFFEEDAPQTVRNFIELAGKGFYDGLAFHRVIPHFIIQTGDPSGTGAGGPGYTIKEEVEGNRQIHDRGVLSMAREGSRTSGSQFFICSNRLLTAHLDGQHTIFGKVIEGLEVIDQIKGGDVVERIVVQRPA
jgi:peptidyl-prolyl cis-trans isomerase B (cyclophilin B)